MYRIIGFVLMCSVLAVAPSAAQVVTGTTGAINGTVTDNTKAVMPGVTVTIESPAMIGGAREAVSDEQGRYQFAAIPPGEYKVTFALPGFSTIIREGIRITLGFTATVNTEMQVASQQETITVTGASPVVDTTATNITNNFDSQTMSNLPTARDFPSLVAETPGVSMGRIDVGGSNAMNENAFTVYGMSTGGHDISTEGIMAPSLANLYNDFGSFEEVQISTAAHTAEMATPGVKTNVIAKSGGNIYKGTFYADYEKDDWASHNIDDEQIKKGITGNAFVPARDSNRLQDYRDVNGGVGGYIKKDKLWWFGSLRYNSSNILYANFPVEPQYTRIKSAATKWTYNLSRNNKLIGYYNFNGKFQPNRLGATAGANIFDSRDSTQDEDFPIGQWKGEYNAVLSDAAFLEARAGKYYKEFIIYSNAAGKPLYNDTSTTQRFGGDRQTHTAEYRPQTNGSISYFKSGFGNSHNFKFGWEIAKYPTPGYNIGRIGRDQKGLEDLDPSDPKVLALPLDIEHRLVNGVPSQVILYQTPNKSDNFQWTYSAYVNDAWSLNDYISFNLGIRYDRYRNGYPDQEHAAGPFNPTAIQFPGNSDVFHFDTFGPRAGVVWNVKGNGKTLVKANWGQYAWRVAGNVTGQNPNPLSWSKTYTWVDRNSDRVWQPGEETALVAQSGGSTTDRIDPEWKNNITTEVASFLERELMANFGMRTGFVWRGDSHKQTTLNPNRPLSAYNVPITVPDPGPDGVAGNADDGPSFTGYNLDPAALALPIINMTTDNPFLSQGDDHYTWEIAATKRMSDHWQLNTSYAKTWSRAAITDGTNPNAFIGTESDQRKHYTSWQAKLAGTVQLPMDFKLSPVVRNQAGIAFGRTITARMNYGNQVIQVEPTSARRTDNVTIVDFRVEKGIGFASRRVGLFFDLFNVLNANPEQAIVMSSGPAFLRPTVIVPPRVARIGAKFEW